MSKRRPKFYKPVNRSIEPGEYDVTIGNATIEESRSSKDMLVLAVKVPGHRDFKEHLVCEESCAWKLALFLGAIGADLNDGDDINPEDYVGRPARVLIDNKEMPDGAIFPFVKKWVPKVKPASLSDTDHNKEGA